jgi:hypothetical protein
MLAEDEAFKAKLQAANGAFVEVLVDLDRPIVTASMKGPLLKDDTLAALLRYVTQVPSGVSLVDLETEDGHLVGTTGSPGAVISSNPLPSGQGGGVPATPPC